jgi:RHH-type rel operon transcriptional repressor/antitoxin RelB
MTKHTVHLPDGLYEHLATLATQSGKTADEVIVAAILEHLEDLEDIRRAEEVLDARAEGDTQTYSLDEVSRKFGLDD